MFVARFVAAAFWRGCGQIFVAAASCATKVDVCHEGNNAPCCPSSAFHTPRLLSPPSSLCRVAPYNKYSPINITAIIFDSRKIYSDEIKN